MNCKILVLLILCPIVRVAADPIHIHNRTGETLYAAIYYEQRGDFLARATDPVMVVPHGTKIIERPSRRYGWLGCYDRDVCFADEVQKLSPLLHKTSALRVNVGTTKGSHFYLARQGDKLFGCNQLLWHWYTLRSTVKESYDVAEQQVRSRHQGHPYAHRVATVRLHDGTLCSEEQQALAARHQKIKAACEALLGESLADDEVPRIALCTSGGGCRAMVSTLGLLSGFERYGLYDLVGYHAALSGSAWAVSGMLDARSSASSYLEGLTSRLSGGLVTLTGGHELTDALLKQYVFTQRFSVIDLYGALLAQKFLKPRNGIRASYQQSIHDIDIAEQATAVSAGTYPVPLATAIVDGTPYRWLEFSPYEVGGVALGSFIPSWSFGRRFYAGSSQDAPPPQSLGFCMGIWGSALSINMREIVELISEQISSQIIATQLRRMVGRIGVSRSRLYPAVVSNWTTGLPLPFGESDRLTLLDAGIDFSIPLLPLLRPEREVDMIIVFDASSRRFAGQELRAAERAARDQQLPFPAIRYGSIAEPCSVHGDGAVAPRIVYIPLRPSAGYCDGWDPAKAPFASMTNFTYKPDEVRLLAGLAEHLVTMNRQTLVATIRACVEKRRLQRRNVVV